MRRLSLDTCSSSGRLTTITKQKGNAREIVEKPVKEKEKLGTEYQKKMVSPGQARALEYLSPSS